MVLLILSSFHDRESFVLLWANDDRYTVLLKYGKGVWYLAIRAVVHCSATVSSACGGRRTMRMTVVVRAADGRRTMRRRK